jgi:ethanolamine utilization protein EutP (predicted NTPase)
LLDFRGAYARNSAAYTLISAIKAEIDYKILVAQKDEHSRIDRKMLDDWSLKTHLAMSEHVQAWERSVLGKKDD